MAEDPKLRLRRINLPGHNEQLAKWLLGAQCRKEVEKVTSQIFAYYLSSLPMSKLDPKVPGSGMKNLKRGADWYVDISGWYSEKDRWFGWVTNTSMSYRKQIDRPYSRVIEYGGGKNNIKPGNQLRDAARLIAGQVRSGEIGLTGVTADPRIRGAGLRGGRGRFAANPLNQDK